MSPVEKVKELISEEVAKEVAKAVAEKNGTDDLPKLVGEIVESRLQELHSRTRSRSTQTETDDDPIDWTQLTEGDKRIVLDIFGTKTGRKQFIRRKSVLSQTSITSSGTSALPSWIEPTNWGWARELGQIFPGGVGSSVKFNQLGGVSIENRTSEKTDRSYGGSIDTTTKVLKNYETSFQISDNALADLESNFYPQMSDLMVGKLDEQLNADALADLKTSISSTTAGTSGLIKTGTADTNLTSTNVVSKLSNLLGKVDSKYWEKRHTAFLVSPDIYELLLASTSGKSGEYSIRPLEDSMTLYGFRIHPTSELDSATTDGSLKAVFANFNKSIGLAIREDFEIYDFPAVVPKTRIFIGQTRVIVHLFDPKGAAGIVVGA